jgi:hypothetical protein
MDFGDNILNNHRFLDYRMPFSHIGDFQGVWINVLDLAIPQAI